MTHTAKDWLMATRPWSFPASAMPVVVVVAWLWGEGEAIDWPNVAAALGAMVLFQAGGNVWSDYFDFRRGVDAADTYGVKILTSGQFAPSEIWRFGVVLFGVAVALGLWMVMRTGPWIALIGVGGTACAVFYPWFKYHALGDVVIFVSYALLPAWGTAWVATATWRSDTLWLIMPVGLITVAILHANNMRDIETDTRAGITTLAMTIGREVSAAVYGIEVIGAYLWVAVGVTVGAYSPWALGVALALPAAVSHTRAAWRMVHAGGGAAATLDERTAQLQLLFSLLFALSFVAARMSA